MELYDLHTHTFLSSCASKTNADPIEYIRAAKQNGLTAVGFADHAWDVAIAGASSWYQNQSFERLYSTRELIRTSDVDLSGIKILFGAETEYAGGVLGVGEKAAHTLDYILVPHSHTHMHGFVLPVGWESPQKHAQYLIQSFYEVCTHPQRGLFFGIAHPMFPNGLQEKEAEQVFSFISDNDMLEGLAAAKENGIFLELNTSAVSKLAKESLSNSYYARFFQNAKKVGNFFFMGSDKHRVILSGEQDNFKQIKEYMLKLGLEESDFSVALDLVRAL